MIKKAIFTVLMVCSSIIYAQTEGKSVDYVEHYTNLANDPNFHDQEVLIKLADNSYFKGDYEKAETYYGRVLAISHEQPEQVYFRSYKCLMAMKDTIAAEIALLDFQTKSDLDWRKEPLPKTKKVVKKIIVNSKDYKVENLKINSKSTEYAPTVYKGNLVFTSSRFKDSKDNSETEQFSTTCLYSSTKGKGGKYSEPKIFEMKNIKTRQNCSSAIFSKDGRTMYFTINVLAKEKSKKENKNIYMLKLCRAKLIRGEWSNEQELNLKSGENNMAHPALSPDGKTLFFVSDLPGGFGDTDIYYVDIDEKGKFSAPVNLGPTINTSGKESFPFVSENGDFYFASNGHPGNGGLDIFVARQISNHSYADVENVGAPINSKADDFSIYIDDETSNIYLSSNRNGGKGFDDIYELNNKKVEEISETITVEDVFFDKEISVLNKNTSVALDNVEISIFNQKDSLIKKATTNVDGKYTLNLLVGGVYRIRFEKQNFDPEEMVVDPEEAYRSKIPSVINLNEKAVVNIAPEKVETPEVVEAPPVEKAPAKAKPAKTKEKPAPAPAVVAAPVATPTPEVAATPEANFEFQNIYFDLNSAKILPAAETELKRILELMKTNPKIKLNIDVYTDSRGSNSYNLNLSNKRADAVFKWFTSNGISKSRLIRKGHGETKLLNECGNNSNCTEEQHAINRRGEFKMKIVK